MDNLSVYSLNCSVCKGEFDSKQDWLNHLVQNEHIRLARREYRQQNWNSKNARECSLVIFMTDGLTHHNARKVIQCLSSWETLVTDFVWWEDRPLVGTIQFESRRQAFKVFNKINGGRKDGCVQIDNQKSHLRKAWKLHQLEWNAIFPKGCPNSLKEIGPPPALQVPHPVSILSSNLTVNDLEKPLEPSADEVTIFPKDSLSHAEIPVPTSFPVTVVQTEKDLVNSVEPDNAIVSKDSANSPQVTVPSTPLQQMPKVDKAPGLPEISSHSNDSRKRRPEAEDKPETPPKKSNFNDSVKITNQLKPKSCDNLQSITWFDNKGIDRLPHFSLNCLPNNVSERSLCYSFYYVRKSVQVREEDFEGCQKALISLKQLFRKHYHLNEVTLFRHWYLKLRTLNLTNDLLVYLYAVKSHPNIPDRIFCVPDKTIKEILNEPEVKANFSVLSNNHNETGWKVKYCSPSGITINFSLMTNSRFLPEVQVCRLLVYMCTFDPRCYSLLTLTHYWAKLNSQSFGCLDDAKLNPDSPMSYFSLPEPHGMQWLVMFFLCHRKYIPTPRQIQERPHQILRDWVANTDIGFEPDSKFAEEWVAKNSNNGVPNDSADHGEDFVFMAIQLFLEFLKFYVEKAEKSCGYILNTRDGELIPTEKFLEDGDWKGSELTQEEIKLLLELQRQKDDSNDCVNKKVNLKSWKLYMTHPFVIQWRFSIAKEQKMRIILRSMKVTVDKLEKYVNAKKKYGTSQAYVMCGGLGTILLVT